MSTPLIELKQVRRHFLEGGHTHVVLREANLSLHRGETLALLGRSGSGKSTLLNLIAGLDKPDAGQVLMRGRDLGAMDDRERTLLRRRQLGFVYQFFNLVPGLTAAENVALPLQLNRVSPADIASRTQNMLDALGLADKAGRFPSQLSGGEQQRVAIGRALVHSPGLVLADEPTGNLDASTGRDMLALLTRLRAEVGGTLLLVTHSLEVARHASRIVTLEDGHVLERAGDFAW